MLYFVFDDFVPPTIANGWPQKNDYWTWESSQANVIYYLGQGTQSVDRFYLYRGGFTPNPESKIMYSLPDYMSPADRYEASGYFIAGTPGTTTLTLSHFANVSNTTPDHVSSFTITVPEESLKVKKNSNNFLPVGSDS